MKKAVRIPIPARGAQAARSAPRLAATVLHVDDDPNDTELLRAASRKADVSFNLLNVPDGEQAIAYLGGRGMYADRRRFPLPVLVLLDLKMPRTTGLEVLKWIRGHAELCGLPVVVLSGSEMKDDIRQAYSMGANSYLIKPLGFNSLVELLVNLEAVWMGSALARTPAARTKTAAL